MDYFQPRRLEEHVLLHLLQILGLLAIALLQVTWLPALAVGYPLNPLLLLTTLATLLWGLGSGARTAFYSGLTLDLVTPVPFGSHTLALLLSVVITALLAQRFNRENAMLPVVATLVAALCYELTLALLAGLVPTWGEWRSYVLLIAVPATLLAAIPALPCFLLLRWWNRRQAVPTPTGARL